MTSKAEQINNCLKYLSNNLYISYFAHSSSTVTRWLQQQNIFIRTI